MLEFGMPTLIENKTLEDNIALCKELGLSFIELNMNFPEYQIDKIEDIDWFYEKADEAGIYYTIHLDENLNVADFSHRMERKASKRDVAWSKENLLKDVSNHRLNSENVEVWFDNHIKIDNTNLLPDEVADIVIEQFKLVANQKEEKEYRFGV